MNPELSRRGAWVLGKATLELSRQLEFIKAVETATTFEDLPTWIRDTFKQIEKKFGSNPAHSSTNKGTSGA